MQEAQAPPPVIVPGRISPHLTAFLGLTARTNISRNEVTRRVQDYIRDRGLMLPEHPETFFLPDEALGALLGRRGRVHLIEVPRLLNRHFIQPRVRERIPESEVMHDDEEEGQ